MYEQEQWQNEPALLTFVNTEDGEWEGIYINDKLYCEGHNTPPRIFIEIINEYKNFWGTSKLTITQETMEKLGDCFPDRFNDIIDVLKSKK